MDLLRALYNPKLATEAFRGLSRTNFSHMPRKPISKLQTRVKLAYLLKESDCGCVLILSSMLDNQLAELHRNHIRHAIAGKKPSKEFLDALTEPGGSLSTFSQRIKMAYALGLIAQSEREALDIIRTLRNGAAHCDFEFHLDDENIRATISQFAKYPDVEDILGIGGIPLLQGSEPRRAFIACAFGLWSSIQAKARSTKSAASRIASPPVPARILQLHTSHP